MTESASAQKLIMGFITQKLQKRVSICVGKLSFQRVSIFFKSSETNLTSSDH